MAEKQSRFAEYNRPELAKLLSALRLDVEYVRGSGDYLYHRDEKGEEVKVLDLACGMGSTVLGHNHPGIKDVIKSCVENDVPMHAQGSTREAAGRLGERLSELYPGREKRITILCNSGTEAVECALKHAEFNRMMKLQEIGKSVYRNYKEMKEYFRIHSGLNLPKKYAEKGTDALLNDIIMQVQILETLPPVVISTEKSFHGKTTGSVRITGSPMYREAFQRLSGIDAKFIEFNNVDDLKKNLDKSYFTIRKIAVENGSIKIVKEQHLNVTAFIMELIQGEGGINVATREFVRGIAKLRKQYGFEWIIDEIQTGLGRTGKLFCIENYTVDKDAADYILLSKALGGGTNKVGAMLVRESIHDGNFGILHSSTFAEDTPGCEVALKALDLLTANKREACRMAAEKGDYLLGKLKEIKKEYPDIIREVRGTGLMIGVDFHVFSDSNSLFFNRCSEQGVFGSVLAGYLLHEHRIRTAPPLNSLVASRPMNVLRIEPSVYISYEDLDRVVFAIRRACEIVKRSNAHEFSKFVIGNATPGSFGDIEDFAGPAYKPPDDPAFEECPRMAFLIHPLDIHQVMEDFDPSLGGFSREKDPDTGLSERERYWDIIVPLLDSFVFRVVHVKSPRTGDKVRAYFIGFLYTTQQMIRLRKTNPELLIEGIQKAVDLGTSLGAEICGLGAFTSIVTHNGTDMDDTYIHITSGNSYTAALVWQSVLKAADYAGINLNECTGAVVGAGGNIGSVCASLLAEDIPKLLLIGSRRSQTVDRLREVACTVYSDCVDIVRTTKPQQLKGLPAALAQDLILPFAALNSPEYRFKEDAIDGFIDKNYKGKDRKIGHLIKSIFYSRPDPDIGRKVLDAVQLKHGADPYVVVSTNLKKSIPQADVVVSAVSADRSIMNVKWFKSGAVVNDASLPPSISTQLYRERPDVIATQGGIGHLPEYINLGIPGLAAGATLGCMAETFILTMMHMADNYSFGSITKQQVVKIWEAGRILGFGIAAIKYMGNKKLTRNIAEEIRRKAK